MRCHAVRHRRVADRTAGVFVTALLAAASVAQPVARQVEIVPVAGSVYLLRGFGGNIGVSVGDDGIVLVDDQFAALADEIREALAQLRDEPVRFILNTHYHRDHTGGNVPFAREDGATVLAHDNVRPRLEDRGVPPDGLPVITFGRGLTLHLNGELIRAIHAPDAHTDGDAVVYFTASNVVHAGDTFVTYGFPAIDVDAGGSIDGMIATAETLIAALPEDVLIIPGHGELSTLNDLREFLELLRETRAAVARGIAAGLDLEALQGQGVLDPWEARMDEGPVAAEDYLAAVYHSLRAAAQITPSRASSASAAPSRPSSSP